MLLINEIFIINIVYFHFFFVKIIKTVFRWIIVHDDKNPISCRYSYEPIF